MANFSYSSLLCYLLLTFPFTNYLRPSFIFRSTVKGGCCSNINNNNLHGVPLMQPLHLPSFVALCPSVFRKVQVAGFWSSKFFSRFNLLILIRCVMILFWVVICILSFIFKEFGLYGIWMKTAVVFWYFSSHYVTIWDALTRYYSRTRTECIYYAILHFILILSWHRHSELMSYCCFVMWLCTTFCLH